MCEVAEAEGWAPIPAERTLRRRIEAEVPRGARVPARHGRKAADGLHPAQTRDRSHFAPCEAVNADGDIFDVFVTAPGRPKPFRPVLVAVQELYSGMILGWRLGETEGWPLVRLAFLDVPRDHGVPREAWLDNGRAFASKGITGGQLRRFRFKVKEGEPEGLLTSRGVTVHGTIPERAQSRPIERAFGDLCEEIARHPACEGAQTGNKPHAKPETHGEGAIPWDDFKALVAALIARHNARPGRNALVCNGRSFGETYRAAVAEAVIPKASPAQLRMLAMVADKVRARAPSGEVHLAGNRHLAKDLVEVAGRDVPVRFDPEARKHRRRGRNRPQSAWCRRARRPSSSARGSSARRPSARPAREPRQHGWNGRTASLRRASARKRPIRTVSTGTFPAHPRRHGGDSRHGGRCSAPHASTAGREVRPLERGR
jgi:hypothetical protein